MSGTASELGLSGRLREVGRLRESNYRGFLPSRSPDRIYFKEENLQVTIMCSSIFVTKVLCIFSVGYADRDHKRSENSSSRRIEKH